MWYIPAMITSLGPCGYRSQTGSTAQQKPQFWGVYVHHVVSSFASLTTFTHRFLWSVADVHNSSSQGIPSCITSTACYEMTGFRLPESMTVTLGCFHQCFDCIVWTEIDSSQLCHTGFVLHYTFGSELWRSLCHQCEYDSWTMTAVWHCNLVIKMGMTPVSLFDWSICPFGFTTNTLHSSTCVCLFMRQVVVWPGACKDKIMCHKYLLISAS